MKTDYSCDAVPSKKTVHELRKTAEGQNELRSRGKPPQGHMLRNWAQDRPFIAWDGEGETWCDNSHHYILFGSSTGASVQGQSVTTRECLDLLLEVEKLNPHAIHVGFAIGYDTDMILADVPDNVMDRLIREHTARWGPYRLEQYRGKYFQVSRTIDGQKIVTRVWDIFSFFRTSFVNVIDQYLSLEQEIISFIRQRKKERKQFTYAEIETEIKPYWELELKFTIELMDRFRQLMIIAGFNMSQWGGPGYLASYVFKKHRIIEHIERELPKEVLTASQYACQAGRFQLWKTGRIGHKIYKVDINSAHPSGIRKLPSLKGREWYHVTNPRELLQLLARNNYGLYKIVYGSRLLKGSNVDINKVLSAPHPFFTRDNHGCIRYPPLVSGWRWTPEIVEAIPSFVGLDANFEIEEAWILDDSGKRPFEFIQEYYDQRLIWKREKNAAEYPLKLVINSIFGKTAQRVGWNKETNEPPRYHQLEWAGYITSHTRSILWPAIWQAYEKGGLIGAETDSVMSTQPLNLDYGTGLGQWDLEVWDDLIYLQNGVYFYKKNGEWKSKIRGLDPESLTLDNALEQLSRIDMRQPFSKKNDTNHSPIVGETTRFITTKMALHRGSKRNVWETSPRQLRLDFGTKAIHNPELCGNCQDYRPPSEAPHDLVIEYKPQNWVDHPHPLPWRPLTSEAEEYLEEFQSGEEYIDQTMV
jgi:hypothetical protein